MSGQSCEPGERSPSWRAELEMGNGHDREALICDRAAASLKVKVQAKGHETTQLRVPIHQCVWLSKCVPSHDILLLGQEVPMDSVSMKLQRSPLFRIILSIRSPAKHKSRKHRETFSCMT